MFGKQQAASHRKDAPLAPGNVPAKQAQLTPWIRLPTSSWKRGTCVIFWGESVMHSSFFKTDNDRRLCSLLCIPAVEYWNKEVRLTEYGMNNMRLEWLDISGWGDYFVMHYVFKVRRTSLTM
jgi:hypothetical protein